MLMIKKLYDIYPFYSLYNSNVSVPCELSLSAPTVSRGHFFYLPDAPSLASYYMVNDTLPH